MNYRKLLVGTLGIVAFAMVSVYVLVSAVLTESDEVELIDEVERYLGKRTPSGGLPDIDD